jgi:aconitase A
LSKVESFVARYPRPDDVVPMSELDHTMLNGCFIGACTTAEEDLIIGALVLEAGLKQGLVPVSNGKRKVVPGSLPILNRLRSLGLADIYEQAGFEVGVPGCSYCVGMGADKAREGEVWLSSQNRNFENRMGTGAIGHLASAATVAASSFGMKIADPQPLLDAISQTRLQDILQHRTTGSQVSPAHSSRKPISYIEPGCSTTTKESIQDTANDHQEAPHSLSVNEKPQEKEDQALPASSTANTVLDGKIQRLPDFVDTDAVSPIYFNIPV